MELLAIQLYDNLVTCNISNAFKLPHVLVSTPDESAANMMLPYGFQLKIWQDGVAVVEIVGVSSCRNRTLLVVCI